MTQNPVYFLNYEGPNITDTFIRVLFQTAQEMFRERSEQKLLKGTSYEAIITTKWRMVGIGTIFGYEFCAKVESGNKTSTVKFLSRKSDLDAENLNIVPFYRGLNPMVTYSSEN